MNLKEYLRREIKPQTKREWVGVISGKLIVTPEDSPDRTVGAVCKVKTSLRGPLHSARIAGRGEYRCVRMWHVLD